MPSYCYCNNKPPPLTGRIRVQVEDFQVEEELGFTPSGAGEHVFLQIHKRNANTQWVADQLAKFAAIPKSAVSYAGLKDRQAITTQWFSVHLPKDTIDWATLNNDSFSILSQTRNRRKLRRGALQGNRFNIVIRDLHGDNSELKQRLENIGQSGVPNYFGAQRFGHDDNNLKNAIALFQGDIKIRDRFRRGLYLSAARAHLFNLVLSARVAANTWNNALSGDVMILNGSQSVFTITDPDDDIQQRLIQHDIHPTGPLWGQGILMSSLQCHALETQLITEDNQLASGLVTAGLKQERRSLRVVPLNLNWHSAAADKLTIEFGLPAGCYATAVLRELVQAQ